MDPTHRCRNGQVGERPRSSRQAAEQTVQEHGPRIDRSDETARRRQEGTIMKRIPAQLTMMPVIAIGLALAMSTMPAEARAFGVEGVGGKLGYSTPEHLDGTAMLGVHAELEERGTRVHLLPNMMYWKVNGVRDVSPNVDAYYHFEREG